MIPVGIVSSARVAPASYASSVLADAPLVYLRLGEASGTTAADSSGNARDGTYYNAPTLGTPGLLAGDADTCVDFDGSNDYAEVLNGAWMNTTGFTVEAIINADSYSSYRGVASRDSGTRGWSLYILGGQLHVFTDAPVLTGSSTLSTGTSYHVALTSTGTSITVYLNGVADGTASASLNNGTGNGLIVAASRAGGPSPALHFDGRIDEFAYYGSALSGARFAAHHAASGV